MREPQVVEAASVLFAELLKRRKQFVILPPQPRMEPRANAFGDGDVDETPLGVDRRTSSRRTPGQHRS